MLEEDLKLLIAYFNEMHYGMKSGVNMRELKTAVFDVALLGKKHKE